MKMLIIKKCADCQHCEYICHSEGEYTCLLGPEDNVLDSSGSIPDFCPLEDYPEPDHK